MKVVEVRGLTKKYGKKTAISNLSFEVNEGELFGFIGPDGAGKTTLFRILTTLLLPNSGSAKILGKDVVKDYKYLRNHIGYMPGRFSLYMDLTVEENLRFFASIFNTTIEENYQLVKDIYSQIEPFKKRRAGQLSGGMKQKLALSCALIHKPRLLVLDEPTTGVDAVSRKEFWEMLKRLKEQGITIIVSTPYMDEAVLCDRIAFIQNGSILDINTPAGIISGYKKKLFSIETMRKYNVIKILETYEYKDSVFPFGDSIHYTDKRESINSEILIDYLHSTGINDCSVSEIESGIEDVFMSLIKEGTDGQ
ncbi:MAG: ABC transporter ATP-binding protein [Ignavibacteriae bacterium]|nr:ABC transporter ATP-binding protein [Ignavibacteriota bacterium]